MLAYLANTLIFIMVGVVIMEKALNSLNEYDLFLLVVDYFGVTVIRWVYKHNLKNKECLSQFEITFSLFFLKILSQFVIKLHHKYY